MQTTGPSRPLARGEQHEQADLDAALANFAAVAYQDWPNKAGFEGLTEERGPLEIPLAGSIPPWAAGALYRTGPGISQLDGLPKGQTYQVSHWFDGLAHTHRFDLTPDPQTGRMRVFYSSRRQADKLVEYIRKNGARGSVSFGQRAEPCIGWLSKSMATFHAAMTPLRVEVEAANVVVLPDLPGLKSLSPIGGAKPRTVHILTDNAMLSQIDPKTLEPVGNAIQSSLHPDLKGQMSCAHAERCPLTGDVYNYNLQFGKTSTYRVFCVRAATGQTEILATISRAGVEPAYLHSFFLTGRYVVLCVQSTHFKNNGLSVLSNQNLVDGMAPFDPKTQRWRWFIVDRTGQRGVVANGTSDAGFFFHSINAYEDETASGDTSLVCDVIEYDSPEWIRAMYYDVLTGKGGKDKQFWGDGNKARQCIAHLARYSIKFASSDKEQTADIKRVFRIPAPHAGELPTINPLFKTKRHRFVYSLPMRGLSTAMDSLVKTDTQTRECLYWDNPHGHSPGEAIFVPRPGAVEEDDGVLLCVVLDGQSQTSYLLCLDAVTMKEVGRADVGLAVGFGFHGVHVAPEA